MSEASLHVDRVACDGRGLCIELLPEILAEDPWGYPAGRDGRRDTAVPPACARMPRRPCGTARGWRSLRTS